MKSIELLKEQNLIVNETIDIINKENRSIMTVHLMGTLRHFVQHIMLVIYCRDTKNDFGDDWDSLNASINYVRKDPRYKILSEFHDKHLQQTISHKLASKEFSEFLFISYIDTLAKIKIFVKNNLSIDILENLDTYPANLDNTFFDYYNNIKAILQNGIKGTYLQNSIYYVQKKKPIIIEGFLFYEVVLCPANDNNEKFDRFIAFTNIDLVDNYAISAVIYEVECPLFSKKVPVRIIESYLVSIRQCEFKKLGSIFGISSNFSKENKEYVFLMDLITTQKLTLNDIVLFSKKDFENLKTQIISYGSRALNIYELLEKCREIILNNKKGCNILKFLLYSANNLLISKQIITDKNPKLSNLYLNSGCIPFEETPFSANLLKTKHLLKDLISSIKIEGHEDELIARLISKKSSDTGQIYVDINEFNLEKEELIKLVNLYNSKLPEFHRLRKICFFDKYLFLLENEELTINILKELEKYNKQFVPNYNSFANSWLDSNKESIKGEEKIKAFKQCFTDSCVYLVYGAAGTGKSTFINFVLNLFSGASKLCLATTFPAVENLKRKINTTNCTFRTISSFNSKRNLDVEFDILVVDECSIVSNFEMNILLQKIKCKVMLLCGDVHQLSPIDFGNWFIMAKDILPSNCWVELTSQFRTSDNKLVELWEKTRNYDENVLEHITDNKYQNKLDDSLFCKNEEDEIILCLNYDGLYGINSINKYLQTCNESASVRWYQYVFKKNDPILFFDSIRFNGVFYNNLKGKILNVYKDEKKITFEVRIFTKIRSLFFNMPVEILDRTNSQYDDVKFSVYAYGKDDYDEDTQEIHIIPFQIAYAVSIHKAQGLEYDSVKVVLTNEIEDKITHNIFYTAITRAKKSLKIYWTPETGSKIIKNIQIKNDSRDFLIFKSKNDF